jgi:hypothetical protein
VTDSSLPKYLCHLVARRDDPEVNLLRGSNGLKPYSEPKEDTKNDSARPFLGDGFQGDSTISVEAVIGLAGGDETILPRAPLTAGPSTSHVDEITDDHPTDIVPSPPSGMDPRLGSKFLLGVQRELPE